MNEETGLYVTWIYPERRLTFPIVLTEDASKYKVSRKTLERLEKLQKAKLGG
jgi:hypothetical protein